MPPVSLWPSLFVGVSALYILYSRTLSAGQAFASGFFFALGYFVTGLWWIGNALLVEGNDFAWVWPISVIGLPTLLALFTGTFLANARMMGNPKSLRGFLAFAFFLTFSEWARGHAFTGFPWNLYGYVWSDHLPMAQAVRYTGAFGLTLITLLWAASPAILWLRRHDRKFQAAMASVVLLSMAGLYAGGTWRLNHNPTTFDSKNAVVVVQPNIPQNMKWDPIAVQDNFLKISSLSKSHSFAEPVPENIFIVWPETAISPTIYSQDANMDRIRGILQSYTETNAYLITGILRRLQDEDGQTSFANSIVFLNNDMTALQAYDKHHLVPFGEFIPFQDWIPLKPVAAFRGFNRGAGPMTVERDGIPPFSPLICYEVIFPDNVTAKGAPRPRWIVNVTNDGWYGDSAGPYQHFAQTRLRAIEEGLPVIRSANTGVSGIIDPYGRVLDRVDIFQEGVIVSLLPEPIAPSGGPRHIFQALLAALGLILIIRLLFSRPYYS